MTDKVRRLFVEKRPGFDVEARNLCADLRDNLGICGLTGIRIINRYDSAGMTDEEYQRARWTIFAEPNADFAYDEELSVSGQDGLFAMEYLPGQYDQRADSAAQCVQILTQKERPRIVSAKVVVLQGNVSRQDVERIKAYCINPVESREASLAKPESLDLEADVPPDVAVLDGFCQFDSRGLEGLRTSLGLAMSQADLVLCQSYFRDTERRDPTMTEIRVIDTYWSDHCRHTTFHTEITDLKMEDGRFSRPIARAYQEYRDGQRALGRNDQPTTLMSIALAAMKECKKAGLLNDLDDSEEINACSIRVDVDVDGRAEEWLVMFKNETHNHPTEIEPFGGAATCLGGAIRDPLSGRAYVYQAMRVTGSADPRTPVSRTLPGKLPQRKITIGAATGYSSYGNQIGLATGQVAEVYHPDFVAKRMEIGAVIAAAPRENVIRKRPQPGDAVILLGGRTGRDGCGGATGSSKEHTLESLANCGAEVQKGNPPTERKLQRLFRNPAASRLIKRCNDFGAGGVSVAIGELADGLEINLDAVPKKYEGLDGTELAISESQERMAVVVEAADVATFCGLAAAENLETAEVARVTGTQRLIMRWRNKTIVDIARKFLDTNGARQYADVRVTPPDEAMNFFAWPEVQNQTDLTVAWLDNLRDLNVCSQKGLVERFDSTIGAGTVLMPFGGTHQLTPAEGMAAKIPLLEGQTETATIMAYGYHPDLAQWSPFHGAVYAVVEAAAKITAMGGDYRSARLTLQEYFEKLGNVPEKWGKPFSALLGAYFAQKRLGAPAIGGKDSMSGTFMDLTVPPTLVAFAVGVLPAGRVVSPEWKQPGSQIVLLTLPRGEDEMPDFSALARNYDAVRRLVGEGRLLAAGVVKVGGVAALVSKMSFGNRLGVAFSIPLSAQELFGPNLGSLILELPADLDLGQALAGTNWRRIGATQAKPVIAINEREISLDEMLAAWKQPLEKIFPTGLEKAGAPAPKISYAGRAARRSGGKVAVPRVFIPVFPGTNCEYDSARAFKEAGGLPDVMVMRNLTAPQVEWSIDEMAKRIRQAQIIMLPGGFSAGDEPDGSGKFIAAVFRNPRIREAVNDLLHTRDGLMLGICNGFQALIKLGLVPYGEIRDIDQESPTLTYNSIGRHISCLVRTRIASTLSPWFANVQVGDIHTIAISHGEGRFVAAEQTIRKLVENGQIATQYVDLAGEPSTDLRFNSNGSAAAVEAITSPDGRVLGKMGHSERIGLHVARNVPGSKDQKIFAAGIQYFQ